MSQALTDSDAVAPDKIACASRAIICSMKLYDEVAVLDEVVAAGDVIVTFEPSAYVTDVVVEPSLLVTDVLDAPCNACSSGSELDPSAPVVPPAA